MESSNILPLTGQPEDVLQTAFAAHRQGDLLRAEAGYYEVLQARPDHPDALHLLGLVGKARGRFDVAEKLIRRALIVRPGFATAQYNLGNVLLAAGRSGEAEQAYVETLRLQPDNAEACYALGNLCRDRGDIAAAIGYFSQALELRPEHLQARHNRANLFRETGRVDESIAELRRVVEQAPDLPEAHYNLALSLFMSGQYAEGASHYEWRWQTQGFTSPRRHFTRPQWNGASHPQKTLLVYAEQGLGDTLQFIRYIHLARPRVGQLIVEVPPALVRLLRFALGDLAYVVSQGQALPPFDYQIALLSLMGLFELPGHPPVSTVPYLRAEPERERIWHPLLRQAPGLRVGINWQGNSKARIDRGRSLPLRLLEPLSRVPGARLISLQKNDGAEQLARMPAGMRVEVLGAGFDAGPDAFIDSAAVLTGLDLFVTTDTALAHLAGALGRPVCLLLKRVPDWRWGVNSSITHWYPTIKLYRQERDGEWEPVISALVKTIESWQRDPA